jgi:hypothetical protein
MDVGAWSTAGGITSVTWAECETCGLGWGPLTGWVETDENPRGRAA